MEINKEMQHTNRFFKYYPTFDDSSIIALKIKKELRDIDKFDDYFQILSTQIDKILDIELENLCTNKKIITKWFTNYSYTANKVQCTMGKGSLFGMDYKGYLRGCHRIKYQIPTALDSNEFKDLYDYGNFNNENTFNNINKTSDIVKKLEENDELTYDCKNCKTLICVKCPAINAGNDKLLYSTDPEKTKEKLLENYPRTIYSSMDQNYCKIENNISIFVYIFDILKRKYLLKENIQNEEIFEDTEYTV